MYCQKCGARLTLAKLCAALWLSFYKCENCGQSYLEVADARWIYPLLLLEPQILDKALAASDEALAQAARQIQTIDYKTVSIVEFEKFVRQI